MSEQTKTTASWLQPILEYLPLVVFLGVYLFYRTSGASAFGQDYNGLLFATLITIPVILLTTVTTKILLGKVPPMQIVMAVLVIGFGGLAVVLNDERFVKIRPTLVFSVFALVLIFGLWTKRLYLKMLMGEQLPMPRDAWRKLTVRAIVFLGAMAALNEVVWRGFSDDVWVLLDKVGQPILFILFFASQIPLFSAHVGAGSKKEQGKKSKPVSS